LLRDVPSRGEPKPLNGDGEEAAIHWLFASELELYPHDSGGGWSPSTSMTEAGVQEASGPSSEYTDEVSTAERISSLPKARSASSSVGSVFLPAHTQRQDRIIRTKLSLYFRE
jgi:hypothetical protein